MLYNLTHALRERREREKEKEKEKEKESERERNTLFILEVTIN